MLERRVCFAIDGAKRKVISFMSKDADTIMEGDDETQH